jgi:hypothetical protein
MSLLKVRTYVYETGDGEGGDQSWTRSECSHERQSQSQSPKP